MTRSWHEYPFKSRDKRSRRTDRTKPKLLKGARPFLERLENRMLLAFNPVVDNLKVTFTSSDTTDSLYLQTDPTSGHLEWHDSNSTSWNDLGFVPGQGGESDVTLEVYNPVHLGTIVGGGGKLVFEGYSAGDSSGMAGFIGPSHVYVDGNIHTAGGGLTIQYVQGLDVSSNAVVSTRELMNYSSLSSSQEQNNASTGNSGAITFGVGNLDPLNQIFNTALQTPQINIDQSALVLANTTVGYQAGEINFSATNVSWNLSGLGALGGSLSLLAREADIYVDNDAVISGNDVSLTSQGGDESIIQYASSEAGQAAASTTNYQDAASNPTSQIVAAAPGGALGTGLATLANKIPALGHILSPGLASFIFKDGTARVEVENDAQIIAAGNVTISATANSIANGAAAYDESGGVSSAIGNALGIELSIAASYAQSNTYALVDRDATIDAGGSVTIQTSGSTDPKAVANIGQDLSSSPVSGPVQPGQPSLGTASPPTNVKQLGIALTISNQTSKATVSEGATITAGGDITVAAGGSDGNTNIAYGEVDTQSYRDGSAGVAININVNLTDVEAEVDGRLTADLSQVKGPGVDQLTFNPFTQADLVDSIIDFGQVDGYQTGDAVTYNSGPGGPIGGLTSGQTYYVIVVDPERIRLAGTQDDATAGNFIVFQPYPTLAAATSASLNAGTGLTFAPGPALSAASASTTLTFTPGPKMNGSPTLAFTPGQGSTPATIDRSNGNWLSDGFAPGDMITVSGTLANNGNYTIGSISLDGTVLALVPDSQNLSAEISSSASVAGLDSLATSSGSWITDGFEAGQTIQVAGTSSNNGSYAIAALSPDGTTLYLPASSLQSETSSAGTITATAGPGLSGTVTLGSGTWSGAGFVSGNSITIAGTAHNDGTYTIQSIIGATLTVASAIAANAGLQTESKTTSSSVTVTASSLTAVTQVNELGDRLSFGFDPLFTDGQAVVYHAVPGQAIGGLSDGQTYYVIRNFAFSSAAVDTTADTLTLPADPGFVTGQPVVLVSSNDPQNIGLAPGHIYDVVVDNSNPDAIQFTDPSSSTPAAIVPLSMPATAALNLTLKPVDEIGLSASSGGPAVDLYVSPQFAGSTQTVSATLKSNELVLTLATGFVEGDRFVFRGATDTSSDKTNNLGLTVGNVYYPVADPNNADAFFIAGSPENAVAAANDLASNPNQAPTEVLTLGQISQGHVLDFSFDPLATTDGTNNTIDMGFNVGLYGFFNDTYYPFGTPVPLVYHGALGVTLTGLTEGQTYYAIIDPASPRLIRLAPTAADAEEAYQTGINSYTANSSADAADATSLGESWFNAGAGTAITAGAPSGPYTVTVSNNEVVFPFNPGLSYGDEVQYAGALPGQPAIGSGPNVLAAGTYFAVPDSNNPNAIGLTQTYPGSSPALLPLSLASGNSTQIQISIGMPQGPFPVTEYHNELVLPFPDGFQIGEQITYLGPAAGQPSISSLNTYADYYVVPDPTNPDAFGLAATAADVIDQRLVPLIISGDASTTSINLGPSLPDTTPAVVSSTNNTLTMAGLPVYLTSASSGTQSLIVAASSSVAVGTNLTFDAAAGVDTTANTITFATADNLTSGALVTYLNGTSNPDIGGLTSGSDYYVQTQSTTTIQLIPVSPIALTMASSETQSLSVVYSSNAALTAGTSLTFDGAVDVDTTANTITYTLPSSLSSGLNTGDEVIYENPTGNVDISGLTSGLTYTVLVTSGDTIQLMPAFATDPGWVTGDEVVYLGNGNGTSDVTGLNVGQDYYVCEQSPGVLQFSASPSSTVSLLAASSGMQNLVVVSSANPALAAGTSLPFDASAGVNTLTNTISFAEPDGLQTGDLVRYLNGTNNPDIGGLASGQFYYVVTVDPSTIELTRTQTLVVPLGTAASVVSSGATPQVILADPLGAGAGPFADTRGGGAHRLYRKQCGDVRGVEQHQCRQQQQRQQQRHIDHGWTIELPLSLDFCRPWQPINPDHRRPLGVGRFQYRRSGQQPV